MKASEIRELSVEELKKRLADEEESLGNLRFQLATSQLESPIKVRTVRRDIARLKTLINEKQRAAAPAAAPKAAPQPGPTAAPKAAPKERPTAASTENNKGKTS